MQFRHLSCLVATLLTLCLTIGCAAPSAQVPATVANLATQAPFCGSGGGVKNLTTAQTTLTIAYAAGLGSGMPGSQEDAALQQTLKSQIDCVLQSQGLTYRVIWGPVVVFKRNDLSGDYAVANTMFVAQPEGSPENFVIGIAGTNPKSKFDEQFEDFDVTLVPWSYGSPDSGAAITNGTLTGLEILLGMEDASQDMDSQTLMGFLKTQTSGGTHLQVTTLDFSLETLAQHVCAYPDQLGLSNLLLTEAQCVKNNPWS